MEERIDQAPVFETKGIVIAGRGVGKRIGVPTANLKIENKENLPAPGVYVSRIFLDGQTLFGVTHIGERPTFDDSRDISFEVHILDFEKNIYGCEITIQLFYKIREPQKFTGAETLVQQINKDCKVAKEYWKSKNEGL
ncbi:MAG: riboflavin kinase [Erysipelotrichaceae bacterium]|jgi:riboflavin kinase/FMN adenylyltransferase